MRGDSRTTSRPWWEYQAGRTARDGGPGPARTAPQPVRGSIRPHRPHTDERHGKDCTAMTITTTVDQNTQIDPR